MQLRFEIHDIVIYISHLMAMVNIVLYLLFKIKGITVCLGEELNHSRLNMILQYVLGFVIFARLDTVRCELQC